MIAILAVAACGYPPLPSNSDGGVGDGKGGGKDSGGGSDGSAQSNCQVPASFGTLNPSTQMADYYSETSQDPEEYDYLGQLDNDNPADYLYVQLVATYAPFGQEVTAPVTITIPSTPDDSQCGGCVIIEADCPDCFNNGTPGSTYMADGGTLKVTSLGSNMVGTVTNATFVHVDINASNGATTVVNDGCTTKITSLSFTAPIQNGN
ncbi:MAG TPA: hypothetical protein VLX92_10130 [Kofleriaceae bacterium]|nr:hypothetical protein [Kofleriaceae bacterium]